MMMMKGGVVALKSEVGLLIRERNQMIKRADKARNRRKDCTR